jgi:hypothetical protein
MPAPDLKRLAVLLDMAITSNQAGEAENALRAAIQLLRKAKLRGSDFIEAMAERDRALDLVKRYAARLDQLEAANKKLHEANGHGGGTLAGAIWADAGMPQTVNNRHAQWLLGLHAQGAINASEKEFDFLNSCAHRSRLSPAQQDWLRDLVRITVTRTGLSPPP